MHLAWKNTTFRAPALSQKFDQMLRLPRKVWLQNHQILCLSQKVRLQNQQMARVPSKVTLQHHQMLRLPQKISSFPFLTVTLLLLSWLACSISQLWHSFPELILYFTEFSFTGHFFDWTFLSALFLYWTCLWWTMPLLYSSITELFLYWTSPFLNYSVTELRPFSAF